METVTKQLTQNVLFATLNDAERGEIARRAIRRAYPQGELFAHQGEVWPYLLLVEAGTIHAVKESGEGRSLMVAAFEPGAVFWGLAFFDDDAPMPVTLAAHAASTVYLWSRESLLPILLGSGPALWELCRMMVRRMERASEILDEMVFQPVAARLARLLLDHFGEAAGPVARDLTLDEMAARIGTTREMVCRVLYRFSDQNLIRITRTEFALNDTAALAKLAGR
jgi:CRP/FNR family transcriptional regulator